MSALGFVAKHADEWTVLENGKVRCEITGHEMPAELSLIQAHLKGKRYRNLSHKKISSAYDFSQHEPHISPHATMPNKLYCHLSHLTMNRDCDVVRKHVNGRRFKRLLREFETRKQRAAEKEKRKQEKLALRDKGEVVSDSSDDEQQIDEVIPEESDHHSGSDDDLQDLLGVDGVAQGKDDEEAEHSDAKEDIEGEEVEGILEGEGESSSSDDEKPPKKKTRNHNKSPQEKKKSKSTARVANAQPKRQVKRTVENQQKPKKR
eukprot:c307_g1_i1.p1 GENE.c307_g1_i1~~c307_g1_i1.p1  ORF type:complete len:262 (-),score=74.72 c307_g1_i1:9-794(-)